MTLPLNTTKALPTAMQMLFHGCNCVVKTSPVLLQKFKLASLWNSSEITTTRPYSVADCYLFLKWNQTASTEQPPIQTLNAAMASVEMKDGVLYRVIKYPRIGSSDVDMSPPLCANTTYSSTTMPYQVVIKDFRKLLIGCRNLPSG